ncbi:hypothetical protein ACFL2S_13420 [Thermodesulfobacteriota bacterium]
MYKFIDRDGTEVGERCDSIKDALDRIRRLRRSGLQVVVVDSSTNVLNNRPSQK